MEIKYYIKNVYGVDRIYIKNADQARAISALTGQKTVSAAQLEALKLLGVNIKHEPIN